MDGTVLIVKITSVVSLRLETRKLMMCRIDLTISSPANGLKCRKNLPLCSTSQFALLFFLWGLCDRQWLIRIKNSMTKFRNLPLSIGILDQGSWYTVLDVVSFVGCGGGAGCRRCGAWCLAFSALLPLPPVTSLLHSAFWTVGFFCGQKRRYDKNKKKIK